MKPEGWEFPRSVYAVVTTIRFSDAKHGIIVMDLKKDDQEQVIAYHTADAGQTCTSHRMDVC